VAEIDNSIKIKTKNFMFCLSFSNSVKIAERPLINIFLEKIFPYQNSKKI
jgi:hypothetical protein